MKKDEFMQRAIEQALKSRREGGIPIGSVLVKNGVLVAEGHNKRVQEKNPILHGEMDCLNNAGRVGSYRGATIYSTLMPCYMCNSKFPVLLWVNRGLFQVHGHLWSRTASKSLTLICPNVWI
jgi:tRNA(Arg) A34 adenosine deaminase TadA